MSLSYQLCRHCLRSPYSPTPGKLSVPTRLPPGIHTWTPAAPGLVLHRSRLLSPERGKKTSYAILRMSSTRRVSTFWSHISPSDRYSPQRFTRRRHHERRSMGSTCWAGDVDAVQYRRLPFLTDVSGLHETGRYRLDFVMGMYGSVPGSTKRTHVGLRTSLHGMRYLLPSCATPPRPRPDPRH